MMAAAVANDAPLQAAMIERIRRDFADAEQETAVSLLQSVKRHHVMAGSDFNIAITRVALLDLADGDLAELKRCTSIAQLDFREVILMATEKNRRGTSK
jgi:hypothetical protein